MPGDKIRSHKNKDLETSLNLFYTFNLIETEPIFLSTDKDPSMFSGSRMATRFGEFGLRAFSMNFLKIWIQNN